MTRVSHKQAVRLSTCRPPPPPTHWHHHVGGGDKASSRAGEFFGMISFPRKESPLLHDTGHSA